MARPPKPLEVHRANGNPGRRPLPEVSLAGTDKPLGVPPRGMSRDEKVVWERLALEMPWLNGTHRASVEVAAKVAARFSRLDRFFAGRRAVMKARKEPEVYAELDDEGKRRHPLMASYTEAAAAYRTALGDIGGSPVAQARLLTTIAAAMRARDKGRKEGERESFLT